MNGSVDPCRVPLKEKRYCYHLSSSEVVEFGVDV